MLSFLQNVSFFSVVSAIAIHKNAQNNASPSESSYSAQPTVIYASDGVQSLNADNGSSAIVILDYGQSVEGIPEFEVLNTTGDTSVFEITYGESRGALDQYMVSVQ